MSVNVEFRKRSCSAAFACSVLESGGGCVRRREIGEKMTIFALLSEAITFNLLRSSSNYSRRGVQLCRFVVFSMEKKPVLRLLQPDIRNKRQPAVCFSWYSCVDHCHR